MADLIQSQIPPRDLGQTIVPYDVLNLIPEDSAIHYRFVPIALEEGVLAIGITDGDNVEARDAAAFIAGEIGVPYKFYLISEKDFANVLAEYKGLSSEVGTALGEIVKKEEKTSAPIPLIMEPSAPKREEKPDVDQSELDKSIKEVSKKDVHITEDAPVTKIVAVIIQHATEGNASDVHIEPIGEKLRVRFRVDGILYTSLFLPATIQNAVVARIKILANMKLDEKRKPQDGRFSANINGRHIDFRVSSMPTYYGEKIAIRILNPDTGLKKLNDIGLTPHNHKLLTDALAEPYGLILLTGPTGSGKTTTLYSMLNEFDREKRNVVSLEDPIEYNIPGINQSQIRAEIDYSFAVGLRSLFRQDPDVIMVGEIRDRETASLAIQAALTGHLVLSTLHTNSAIGVIPRLVDMGIDPYLIAPTLILSVAQRLVRTICSESKDPMLVEGAVRQFIDKQLSDLPEEFRKNIKIPEQIFRAKPSATCSTGTRGRTAVFEMFKVNRDVQNIILKSPTENDLYREARAKGMLTMKEDALLKAFDGTVSFEEVNRL
ncbi:MAG: GspE/PulE family protein [Patescibacteria group bacterium]